MDRDYLRCDGCGRFVSKFDAVFGNPWDRGREVIVSHRHEDPQHPTVTKAKVCDWQ